jgi:hypothetical protein
MFSEEKGAGKGARQTASSYTDLYSGSSNKINGVLTVETCKAVISALWQDTPKEWVAQLIAQGHLMTTDDELMALARAMGVPDPDVVERIAGWRTSGVAPAAAPSSNGSVDTEEDREIDIEDAPPLADGAGDHDTNVAPGPEIIDPPSLADELNGRRGGAGGDDADDLAARMHALFAGSDRGHGSHGVPVQEPGAVKWTIRNTAITRPGPATLELWKEHLKGGTPLGVIPIRGDDACLWGGINVDEYNVNLLQVIAKVEAAGLVPCRSKSGGFHLFLFLKGWIRAEKLNPQLIRLAARLGLSSKTEIFPKQLRLVSEHDRGNWITMPYGQTFGGKLCAQVGLRSNGTEMTAEEFLDCAEKLRASPVDFDALLAKAEAARGSKAARRGSKRRVVEAVGHGDVDDTVLWSAAAVRAASQTGDNAAAIAPDPLPSTGDAPSIVPRTVTVDAGSHANVGGDNVQGRLPSADDHEIDDTDAASATDDYPPDVEDDTVTNGGGGDTRSSAAGGVNGGVDTTPASGLPAALQPLIEQHRWVLWKWETRENGKRTKVPYQPNGKKASSTNPETWISFAAACAAREKFDGIGFCLFKSGIAAFDIDNCRDPKTGAIHPWAKNLVEKVGSYSEITVSGTGLRIIGYGNGPKVHRKLAVADGVSCELYRQAERYIVMTGDVLPGARVLANIDEHIDAVLAELDNKKQSKGNKHDEQKSATDNLPPKHQSIGNGRDRQKSATDKLPPKIASMLHIAGRGEYPSRSELLFAFLTEALRRKIK